MSHWDNKAKLLGCCRYKMKVMFQLWDNISSVISWIIIWTLARHRTDLWTHWWVTQGAEAWNSLWNQPVLLPEHSEAAVLSQSFWIDWKGHWPKLALFPHLFSMVKCTRVIVSAYSTSQEPCDLWLSKCTGCFFQRVISTLLWGIQPRSRHVDLWVYRHET